MEFEWDAEKAASSLSKHGVSFAEAMTVFGDPPEVMIPTQSHSHAEMRFVSVGISEAGRLSVVAYAERDQRIRIISAWEVTPREKRQYESTGQS